MWRSWFVVYDMMRYFDKDKLKLFLDAIWKKYPGAEVVFDAKNSVAKHRWETEACSWVKNKGTNAAGEHR